MSDTHVKCQGLWQLSKYRPYNPHPGILPVFICQVGKPAVLGQHSPRIKLISDIWHQVAACHLKLFIYDKSTVSPNMLYIMWANWRVLHQPQTCDNEDTSPIYIPPPDFSILTFFTYFWIKDTHLWWPADSLHIDTEDGKSDDDKSKRNMIQLWWLLSKYEVIANKQLDKLSVKTINRGKLLVLLNDNKVHLPAPQKLTNLQIVFHSIFHIKTELYKYTLWF